MGVSRVCGLLFVSLLALETVLLTDLVAEADRRVYCTATSFILNALAVYFWVNQLMIALLRWPLKKEA